MIIDKTNLFFEAVIKAKEFLNNFSSEDFCNWEIENDYGSNVPLDNWRKNTKMIITDESIIAGIQYDSKGDDLWFSKTIYFDLRDSKYDYYFESYLFNERSK